MSRSKRTRSRLIPIRPLVAMVIVSLLLALGIAGLHRVAARRSEMARAEALFGQARSTAIGKGTTSVVLIDDSSANPFKKPNHP